MAPSQFVFLESRLFRLGFVLGKARRVATVRARVSELVRHYRVRRAALIRRRTDASHRFASPRLASPRVTSCYIPLSWHRSPKMRANVESRMFTGGPSNLLSPNVLSTSSLDGTPRMQTDVTCRCNMLASTRRNMRINTNAWHCRAQSSFPRVFSQIYPLPLTRCARTCAHSSASIPFIYYL